MKITTEEMRKWAEALRKGQDKQIVPQFKDGVCFAADVLTGWVNQLEDIGDEVNATAPMLQMGRDGTMPVQQEPSPLEVALRLIESGKCPAIPTQARDMAFNLITCIRAEEARRAGK